MHTEEGPFEDTERRQHLQAKREALGEFKPPTLQSWVSSLQDYEK